MNRRVGILDHSVKRLVAAALIVLVWWAALPAFQGMGTTRRAPRAVKPVATGLPPVTVDFRDVAVQAGVTAVNVSGGAEKKSC